MAECGYLYVAGGKPQYIQEAMISAKSLKVVDPTAHVTLITDNEIQCSLFDKIVLCPAQLTERQEEFGYKPRHLYDSSPYERTLFVDTDTYFYENCRPLFKLLDYFDVCMAAAPIGIFEPLIDGAPLTGCAPYNSGVIAFKKNAANAILFRRWWEIYEKKLRNGAFYYAEEGDQTSFMEALLHSESRVYVLSNAWNARTPFYIGLKGTVKIVHGRHEDYEVLRRKLNVTNEVRCWDPMQGRCIYRKRKRRMARLWRRFKRICDATRTWSQPTIR